MATATMSVKLEMTPEFKAMYDEVTSFLNPIAEASLDLHECVVQFGWDSDLCIPKCQSWDRAVDALKKRRSEVSDAE